MQFISHPSSPGRIHHNRRHPEELSVPKDLARTVTIVRVRMNCALDPSQAQDDAIMREEIQSKSLRILEPSVGLNFEKSNIAAYPRSCETPNTAPLRVQTTDCDKANTPLADTGGATGRDSPSTSINPGFRQRIKQIDHQRPRRENKFAGIATHRLHRKSIAANRSCRRSSFSAPPDAKRETVRSQECGETDSPQPSRAHGPLPEPISIKVNSRKSIFRTRHHLLENRRLGGLIGRMKVSQQTLAPTDGRARGIDAVVPIIFRVSVANAPLRWRRLQQKFPEVSGRQSGPSAKIHLPPHPLSKID